MKAETDQFRETVEQALAQCRDLMTLIEAGEIDAIPSRIWHLRGAIDALAALLEPSSEAPPDS